MHVCTALRMHARAACSFCMRGLQSTDMRGALRINSRAAAAQAHPRSAGAFRKLLAEQEVQRDRRSAAATGSESLLQGLAAAVGVWYNYTGA
jgi:hypothetical protein